MSLKYETALLTLAISMAAPATAWAVGGGGGGGCANLPEYYRAQGALQGLSTCGLSVEQARRIIAAQDGTAAAYPQGAPKVVPEARRHYPRQRTRPPQE